MEEIIRNALITAGLTYSIEEEPVMMRVVPLDEVVKVVSYTIEDTRHLVW